MITQDLHKIFGGGFISFPNWVHFQYRLLVCSFAEEWAPSQALSVKFAWILRASFSRSALEGCLQMQIFLLLIFLNVDFYNRINHRVVGVLFSGNNANICTVIDCSKIDVQVFEEDCRGFHFLVQLQAYCLQLCWVMNSLAVSFKEFLL